MQEIYTSVAIYGKMSMGKTFAVFIIFHSTANVFLWTMALLIENISQHQCYNESFTESLFCILKTNKKRKSFLPWMFSCIQYYFKGKIHNGRLSTVAKFTLQYSFNTCTIFYQLVTIVIVIFMYKIDTVANLDSTKLYVRY